VKPEPFDIFREGRMSEPVANAEQYIKKPSHEDYPRCHQDEDSVLNNFDDVFHTVVMLKSHALQITMIYNSSLFGDA
jgi:hypothetical protein